MCKRSMQALCGIIYRQMNPNIQTPSLVKEYSRPFIAVCLVINVALSISIVFINKLLYSKIHFPNMTLTCIHFIFTTVGMCICKAFSLFEFKRLPVSKMIPISLTFCGFVVLTNLSLQSNTVGTYQIIKTLTTPGIIVIQTFFYGRTFSSKVKLTLIPITIGVFLNSYFDLRFNLLGLFFALSGVVVTSLYQVWVNEKQVEFKCDSMQLLFYQAPLSALGVSIIVPFFEPVIQPGGIFSFPWDVSAVVLVMCSGTVAFAINLSIFWIIGNTSPLTYNMVGHLKFCLTVSGGYLLFSDPIQAFQLLGICLTFSGVIAYTNFKMEEQRRQKITNKTVSKATESLEEVLIGDASLGENVKN